MEKLEQLCRLVQYDIITSTTEAGTGHPSSSLSATQLMTVLFFGGHLHYDLSNPNDIFNDRIIFSKGHASPLYYALFQAAGILTHKDLMTLRRFDSDLEGHPTPRFKYCDVSTGSLGQGLSIGVGMALGIKLHLEMQKKKVAVGREPHVFVLLGDSEMAEGQVWEAMEIASHYKLNNLVAVVDVNRLGQRGETMLGWDLKTYEARAKAFGWNTIVLEDGHDLQAIDKAYQTACKSKDTPTMIIAKTKKGYGIKLLEDLDNWHGKSLPKDKLEEALNDIGKVDLKLKGDVKVPELVAGGVNLHENDEMNVPPAPPSYKIGDSAAVREAYGEALVALGTANRYLVVLDAEVSNSTYADKFKKAFPNRYFEMYIAEQNMASVALGFSKLGFVPFISSFAAFLTRAYDQIRMAQYSEGNVKVAGSHAGVSIGYDGASQMALEDLSMFRSILESTVLYPSDAVSTHHLVMQAMDTYGMVYLRTTREKTPVLYDVQEPFPIGGSKILKQSTNDAAVVFTAGITLSEALKAHEMLKKENINIAVVDLYSIKPIDEKTILEFAKKTSTIIVVEDHYPTGGIGEAVAGILQRHSGERSASRISKDSGQARVTDVNFVHLAVTKIPRSGSPEELLRFEEIDAEAIVKKVKETALV